MSAVQQIIDERPGCEPVPLSVKNHAAALAIRSREILTQNEDYIPNDPTLLKMCDDLVNCKSQAEIEIGLAVIIGRAFGKPRS